jgi:hypothetical protein
MSNSAVLNVHRVISFASVVGSTKANIAVALITGVLTAVYSVEMIPDYAVHGVLFFLYDPPVLLRKVQRRASWEACVRGVSA